MSAESFTSQFDEKRGSVVKGKDCGVRFQGLSSGRVVHGRRVRDLRL